LAFELAKQNSIENAFPKEKKSSGKKWLDVFLSQNTNLSLRREQGLSFSRANMFTSEAVATFYYILKQEMDRIRLAANRLYNCDETGITIVHLKHTKVTCLNDKRQISALQPAESGSLI
jgi:hypothetical protein